MSTAQASPVPPRLSTLLPETPEAGGASGARGSVAAGRIGATTLAAVAPPTGWFTESL
ncbi:MAG: hypothetical protein RJA59_187, partial [Pseudomonadota bacterium]